MAESRHPGRHLAPALVACAAVGTSHGAELTIDRLFDAPSLTGNTITGLKFSPDGSRVTYLQGKAQDKDRLDLWEYDLKSGRAHLLIDSDSLQESARALSPEEAARRERQRVAALSGILDYDFIRSGNALLIPMQGHLYLFDPAGSGKDALRRLGESDGFATDAAPSPQGNYIGFIRDQNLYVYDIARGAERALTQDGGGAIKNGMAEFVAQEEMDRSTGYWWAPDERHIAFARVDESGVTLAPRFEISADGITTFEQRYPAAGEPNALVRLGVANVRTGAITWIDLGAESDVYLARVNWLPDGKTLAIQRESRDQRRLDLLFADIATGASRLVLTETSDSWIDLNEEISFLRQSKQFIWASSRDGFQHLYLYDDDGRLRRRLTGGAWNVDDFRARAIKAIDEPHRLIYFMATEKSPTERHLYVTSLDTSDPAKVRRVSQEAGIHGIAIAPGAACYLDSFTSSTQPPQVSLHAIDGRRIAYVSENRLDERHPDAPYLADNAAPEFGTLTAPDGELLYYRLFKPRRFDPAVRHPAIIEVYGGPGIQRVLDEWTGSSFTQILTRAGYVVFQLDNRGSGFRGKQFQAGLLGRLGELEVRDQVQGAEWLASQPYVDPSRIGVWGWSYGGYMTLMLMFKAPQIFRAGVSGAPVIDFAMYDTHYTERYLGRPQDNAAGYAASSVLTFAPGLAGKLLVIHGMADDNVLFLNSAKLFRRLQDLGKPFEMMLYPGAKHGLLRQRDGRHAYGTMLRFFEDNLRR